MRGTRSRRRSPITPIGSRARWRLVRKTVIRICCVCADAGVRLPPQILRLTIAGRSACSARQLLASMGRVVQEAEKRRPFAVEMSHQAPDRRNPTALVKDRRQARLQVSTRHGKPVVRHGARRVPVTQVQGLLQDSLDVGWEQGARMIGL